MCSLFKHKKHTVQKLGTDTMQNKSKSMPSLVAIQGNSHKLICEEGIGQTHN